MVTNKRDDKTRYLAEWISQVRFEDIPARVIRKAKLQFLSIWASACAGSRTPGVKALLKTVEGWDEGASCTLLPPGKKTSLRGAILFNSGASIALDYDDYLLAAHTGVSAVPLALAFSEKLKLSGRDLLLLQVIVNEVAGRIGASVALGPQNGQAWSFVHLGGGAAAASRAFGLSPEETTNALGAAFYQSTFTIWPGFMGPHTKLLTAGLPATIGVLGAELARSGFTGSPEILEHPIGFINCFADIPTPAMISGLGKAWVTDTLCLKVYPACAYVDPVADCVEQILKQHPGGIKPEQVEEVVVSGGITSFLMDELSSPFTSPEKIERNQATIVLNFNLPYNVAAFLLDGELTPRQLTLERARDPKIWELAKRVRTVNDPRVARAQLNSLLSLEPLPDLKTLAGGNFDLADFHLEKLEVHFSGRVEIRMKNGKVYAATQDIPFGAAGRPLEETEKLIREKFIREGTPVLGEAKVNRALELVAGLDELTDLRELISSLIQ